MKFDIIATQEHSQADFSALLAFSSPEHAKIATKAICDSKWANTQRLTLGESGAFQVGNHVMFNTYSEDAYGKIIDMLKKLPAPATEYEESNKTTPAKAMFALLATTDTSSPLANPTRKKIQEIASRFFLSYLPEATFSDCCVDNSSDCSGNGHDCEWVEVWFGYKGREYHVDFVSTIDSDYINLWSTDKDCNLDVVKVTPESLANTISTMDRDGYFPETHKDTPEEKIFNLINNTTMPDSVFVSAGKEFLTEYLPEATFCSFNTDNGGGVSWYALWFKVNERDFRLDFNIHADKARGYELHEVYEDGDMGMGIPATPVTLRKTIAMEPAKKSVEDRVARLETLVGEIQEEIKTIKKNI